MTTPVEAVLSFRRAGATDWVDIDPRTARGQRLLALFGIITKEKEMTAATAETFGPGPRLRPVTDPQAARMGLLLRARMWMRRAWDKMLASGRAAWGWIERTFHLEAVKDYTSSGYNWLKTQIRAGAAWLGGSGVTGLGLLTIATQTGRNILHFLWRPVGWVLKSFLKGWDFIEQSLHSDKREGGIRNWLSDRMANVREFFIGDADPDSDRIGVIGGAIALYFKYVYPLLRLDSFQMKAARTLGSLMFGLKVVAAIAFLPFSGMFLTAMTILGYAGVAYAATSPWGDEVAQMKETVSSWFDKEKREAKKTARASDKHGEQTAAAFEHKVDEAKAEADAKLAAEEATTGEAPNRSSRRATKTATGNRRR